MDELWLDDENDKDMEAIKDLSRAMVREKVMAILRSHAGLIRSVRLTLYSVSDLRAWLWIMAAKGMEEPIALNCEWPAATTVL